MLARLRAGGLFIGVVIIPTLLAIFYNFFYATPVYISSSKVVVKNLGSPGSVEGFGAFLSTLGILQPTSGSYLVMDYILSKDAMFKLEGKFSLKEHYSSERWDILKRFDPFGINPSYENFYEYYKDRVIEAYIDTHSGVLTMKVRSAEPEYSYAIAKELITLSEEFVNKLNERSAKTALLYYREQLERSREKVKKFAKKIKRFLNKKKLVSPEQQVAVLLQLIAELQSRLISRQLELSTLKSVAPQNPRIKELEREIVQIKKKIDKLLKKLAGSKNSLATHSVELQLLQSEFDLLRKEVEINLMAFLQAQNQAYLQHLFIETVESPRIPDAPMEPRKLRNVFVTFVVSFALWGVLMLFISGIREHVGE